LVRGPQKGAKEGASGGLHAAKGDNRNFPPLLLELQKQYPDEEMDRPDSGTIYIGEKGVLYTATYGNKFHILPLKRWQKLKARFREL